MFVIFNVYSFPEYLVSISFVVNDAYIKTNFHYAMNKIL